MEKKDIEKAINENLSLRGFRKKSSTWYLGGGNALHVINLQKSSYGNQYYLNISFVPKGMEIDGLPTPKEYKCPIRIRFSSLLPDCQDEIERAFNFEDKSLEDVDRLQTIANLFAQILYPFLDKVEKKGLKFLIENGFFDSGGVALTAKAYLEIADKGK